MTRCCQRGRAVTLDTLRALAALLPDGPKVSPAEAGARLSFADGDSLSSSTDKVATFLLRELEAMADAARERLHGACASETVDGYVKLLAARDEAERRASDARALLTEGGAT